MPTKFNLFQENLVISVKIRYKIYLNSVVTYYTKMHVGDIATSVTLKDTDQN